MWANPWIIKEIIKNVFKIMLVCGGAYYIAEAFAKVTYKIHKTRILKKRL